MAGERVLVVGTTGSGKTTLAARLARQLGCPHIELDALHWEPGWTEAPLDVFRQRVQQAVCAERWVVDGNYGKVRDIVLARADTVVWLDYPLPLVLWRLFWRTLHRIVFRVELWNGNRERFAEQFFSRDSIFLWALQTHGRRRRDFLALLQAGRLRMVRLRAPGQAEAWLRQQAAGG